MWLPCHKKKWKKKNHRWQRQQHTARMIQISVYFRRELQIILNQAVSTVFPNTTTAHQSPHHHHPKTTDQQFLSLILQKTAASSKEIDSDIEWDVDAMKRN